MVTSQSVVATSALATLEPVTLIAPRVSVSVQTPLSSTTAAYPVTSTAPFCAPAVTTVTETDADERGTTVGLALGVGTGDVGARDAVDGVMAGVAVSAAAGALVTTAVGALVVIGAA